MNRKLFVLMIEDNETDAELNARFLQKSGYDISFERVETAGEMEAALGSREWDVILADFQMPRFDAPAALKILHRSGLDIPFLVVSGVIGEDKAVEMMKAGAHDYFLKNNLTRLPMALERELQDAVVRKDRRCAEEAIKESREQLKIFAAHLQSIREEERILISRELHDNLGQCLTALKIDTSRIIKKLNTPGTSPDISTAVNLATSMIPLIDSTIELVRKITSELRPRVLDEAGLIPAIEWQLDQFSKRTSIQCSFHSELSGLDLEPSHSVGVFRIFQEALTNIMRHANASRVDVKILQNDLAVILDVEDNGCGINSSSITDKKSLGLLGMKERAVLFGGDVFITGEKGIGTKVMLSIPLKSLSVH